MNDIFSVDTIPGSNSLAAFIPKQRQSYREDADLVVATTPDGIDYVAWGADDMMPYDIIDLVESDETISTCQAFNAEVCYAGGLRLDTCLADDAVKEKVDEFLMSTPSPELFLGLCQDIVNFSFAVTELLLNADASAIVSARRKQACYCRFAKASDSGHIPYIVYGNFRNPTGNSSFDKITLLSQADPWRDLLRRVGRLPNRTGAYADSGVRRFAVLSKFPGVDQLYYPIPPYAAIFRGNWFNIKRLIGVAKEAKLKNAAPIKYVIEISQRYWDAKFRDARAIDPEARNKIVAACKKQMLDFLTDAENSGTVLFTGKSLSADGSKETPDVTVTPIDSRVKEGGDWSTDIAEAINMICFAMRVHSNLVGSVPGKAQSNNSGSDKRELYTIAQALKKPYRDVLFLPIKIIIRFNGWKNVSPVCELIQLTTLDEHADAKTVTAE